MSLQDGYDKSLKSMSPKIRRFRSGCFDHAARIAESMHIHGHVETGVSKEEISIWKKHGKAIAKQLRKLVVD